MAPKQPPATPSPSAQATADARRRILDAAFDLFHGQGVEGTGLEQILERSGTGKSQLYHYFGSKDGLVLAVVLDFEQRLLRGELPGAGGVHSLDDVARWFDAFVGFQRATGAVRHCPMATIAADLDPGDEETRATIVRIFDRARAPLRDYFAACAAGGRLAPGADADDLADFCIVVMQGGLLVSRVRRDPEAFARAAAQALAHVRALVRERD